MVRLTVVFSLFFLIFSIYSCNFTIARLKYNGGGDWYANPSSLPNLITALRERTTAAVCPSEVIVTLTSEDLYKYPFLHITGHGNLTFNKEESKILRRYLKSGGFLFVDDNYGLNESFRTAIKNVFPGRQLIELPLSHPIYNSFYSFPMGLPKIHKHDGGPPKGFGLFLDGRMVLFYSFNTDIGDGLEDITVHNDTPEKHEVAIRFAINVVYWFLKGID